MSRAKLSVRMEEDSAELEAEEEEVRSERIARIFLVPTTLANTDLRERDLDRLDRDLEVERELDLELEPERWGIPFLSARILQCHLILIALHLHNLMVD